MTPDPTESVEPIDRIAALAREAALATDPQAVFRASDAALPCRGFSA